MQQIREIFSFLSLSNFLTSVHLCIQIRHSLHQNRSRIDRSGHRHFQQESTLKRLARYALFHIIQLDESLAVDERGVIRM